MATQKGRRLPRLVQRWLISRSTRGGGLAWWLRTYCILQRQSQANPGFVLPAAVLVLLVLSLTVGALFFRTLNRHTQVALRLQEQVLINAATPAIERAKAKLEYLFLEDPNLPTFPRDIDISRILKDEADEASDYTFSGETRLDLDPATSDEDGNAWTFNLDYDGDGQSDAKVAYAIFHKATDGNIDITDLNKDKAPKLVVRNGPINLRAGGRGTGCRNLSGVSQAGWESVTSGILRKTFQVTAVVLRGEDPDSPARSSQQLVTLEMQQDRQANQGNIWSAWFLDDLEFRSGDEFNWNGAMHTQGNLFLSGSSDAGRETRLFLVSSPSSCIFSHDASKITLQETDDFQGQVVSGQLGGTDARGDAFFTGPVDVHYQDEDGVVVHRNGNGNTVTLSDTRGDTTNLRDSVFCPAGNNYCVISNSPCVISNPPCNAYPGGDRSLSANRLYPSDLAVDPIRSLTQGITRSRTLLRLPSNTNMPDDSNKALRANQTGDNAWNDQHPLVKSGRIANAQARTPFVDDTYRADNRWGPKVKYTDNLGIYVGGVDCEEGKNCNGDPIVMQQDLVSDEDVRKLTSPGDTSSRSDDEEFGLDGYWERRTHDHGVRIIVGQRLELGNPLGWINEDQNGDGNEDSDATGPLVGNAQVDVDFMNVPDPLRCYPETVGQRRCHERRQGRTFRDNLAAVQSTAIYHYLHQDGKFPVACLASTTHPGTWYTIQQARTFNTVPVGVSEKELDIDFLYGRGTNGWEFKPPGDADSDSAFKNLIDQPNDPLRRALKNLAYLSGDPHGAFPPRQDTWDGDNDNDAVPSFGPAVHPHPTLTMWGDYSNLRRVIKLLDDGTANAYNDLSIADRSTLHTASCTLGMLAYSLDTAKRASDALATGTYGSFTSLGTKIWDLINIDYDMADTQSVVDILGILSGNDLTGDQRDRLDELYPVDVNQYRTRSGGNIVASSMTPLDDWTDPNVDSTACTGGVMDTGGFERQCDIADFYRQFSSYEFLVALKVIGELELSQNLDSDVDLNQRILEARRFRTGRQILRDRNYGFARGPALTPTSVNSLTFQTACDPGTFADSSLSQGEKVSLAIAFCQDLDRPHFPSLYYLFPRFSHDHDGDDDTSRSGVSRNHDQPNSEPYIGDDYISNNLMRGVNDKDDSTTSQDFTYQVVKDDNRDGIENGTEDSLRDISLTPKGNSDDDDDWDDYDDDWALPQSSPPTDFNTDFNSVRSGTSDNAVGTLSQLINEGCKLNSVASSDLEDRECETGLLLNIIQGPDGLAHRLGFMDKAFFNGREQMVVRALDIDLDLLRRTNLRTGATPDYYWVPLPSFTGGEDTATGAIFYAFREDAVREDAIARPRKAEWNDNAWRHYVNQQYDETVGSIDVEDYLMDAQGWNRKPKDPPLYPGSRISPKPVDFFPDPDRRPYGFRLRNGEDLGRIGSRIRADDLRGFSFITDNAVYIQGDFNLHQDNNGDPIQEFTEDLSDSWGNFYSRSTPNEDFAYTPDRWRVAEIVADAVHILSHEFKDGWISGGLTADLDASYGINSDVDVNNCNEDDCIENDARPQPKRSNYYAFYHASDYYGYAINRPSDYGTDGTNNPLNNLTNFRRLPFVRYNYENQSFEGGWDARSKWPILVNRNGSPLWCDQRQSASDPPPRNCPSTRVLPWEQNTSVSGDGPPRQSGQTTSLHVGGLVYPKSPTPGTEVSVQGRNNSTIFKRERIGEAVETTVNALIVQGLVAIRGRASVGFENYLRLLERWKPVGETAFPLNFAGSFQQLNYSTSSTAHLGWNVIEPGETTDTPELDNFYVAPQRNWGYDPALQYAPPGAVAIRFTTPSRTRSEFYRELPADDDYIRLLRCAEDENDNPFDEHAPCTP